MRENTVRSEVAIAIPSYRPESMVRWLDQWRSLISRHSAVVVTATPGKRYAIDGREYSAGDLLGDDEDLIDDNSSARRNLALIAAVHHVQGLRYLITLDDDTSPVGDTIADHIAALDMRTSTSWLCTASRPMRGMPYGVREESPVMVSHGVWEGVPDWDAPTQLAGDTRSEVKFFRGAIPRGVYAPLCGMNVGLRPAVLPYYYWAPTGRLPGAERFDDIWAGLHAKEACDQHGWAVVSGYATVRHDRASNVFVSLEREATGIRLHERYWKHRDGHPFFAEYDQMRSRWRSAVKRIMPQPAAASSAQTP